MNFSISIDNRTISVEWIKKSGLKNLYMRIINENQIRVKSNRYFQKEDIQRFINGKSNWIIKNLEKISKKVLPEDEFYFLGGIYKLDDYSLDKTTLKKFYKEQSKILITKMVEEYSQIMHLYPSKLTFRDNKSRWGSCSFNNSINLNINLMKLDLELIKYVVVHELAHIKHKNHSKKFYAEIEKYLPSYREYEKKLKYF